jgi:hypothetical protein
MFRDPGGGLLREDFEPFAPVGRTVQRHHIHDLGFREHARALLFRAK